MLQAIARGLTYSDIRKRMKVVFSLVVDAGLCFLVVWCLVGCYEVACRPP